MTACDGLIEVIAKDAWERDAIRSRTWESCHAGIRRAYYVKARGMLEAALAYRDSDGRRLVWGKRAHRRIGDHETLFVACDIDS